MLSSHTMRVFVLALTLLVAQTPKFNPTGTWEAETGSRFQINVKGSDVTIKLVPGSNQKYVRYDVSMTNDRDPNSYKGSGTFVAKMDSGKECKFDTEWRIAVVAPERIVGVATNIFADSKTCEIKEKKMMPLDLKKK